MNLVMALIIEEDVVIYSIMGCLYVHGFVVGESAGGNIPRVDGFYDDLFYCDFEFRSNL